MLYYTEDGDTITIDRATTVVININGVPRMVRTNAQTVGEVLEEMDDKIGEDYKNLKEVTEDDKVTDNSVIVVHLPKEIITSRQIDVAYETEYIEEPSMLVGQEKVVQEGVNGKSIITLKETYIDDEVVSSEEMSSEVITEPVKEIVKKGTSYGNNDSIDVSSLSYSKKMTVQATGYTPYDPGCNGITASGTKAEKGVIAVDPKVIPMDQRFIFLDMVLLLLKTQVEQLKEIKLTFVMKQQKKLLHGEEEQLIYIFLIKNAYGQISLSC